MLATPFTWYFKFIIFIPVAR